jgi:hypothetical protein
MSNSRRSKRKPAASTDVSALEAQAAADSNATTAVLALARLLGRQAAREAFRAALTDSQATDSALATPATPTDEE